MHLTKEDLQDKLAPFVGTSVDYAAYSLELKIQSFVRDAMEQDGYARDLFTTNKPKQTWKINIMYRGWYIGEVKILRKKGKRHYGVFSDWVNYLYNGFEVKLLPDLQARLNEIDDSFQDTLDVNAKRNEIALEVCEYIKEKYNCSTEDAIEIFKAGAKMDSLI